MYPGPIDNNGLRGRYGDEMKRNLVEGTDFVLLPGEVADILLSVFKGGPTFVRKVVSKVSVLPRRYVLHVR